MQDRTAVYSAVGADPHRKSAPAQAFGNDVALRGNPFLTVALGSRGIQQNIHRQISVL